MKLRTLFAATVLTATTLACSGVGGSSGSAMSDYSVDMTDPWTSMSLPIDSGNVIYSDSSTLTVLYDGGDVHELGAGYVAGLEGAGWTVSNDFSQQDQVIMQLTKDATTLSIAVMSSGGNVTVALNQI